MYKGPIHVSGKKSTTFGTRPPSAIIFSYNFQLTIVQYHLSSNKRLKVQIILTFFKNSIIVICGLSVFADTTMNGYNGTGLILRTSLYDVARK